MAELAPPCPALTPRQPPTPASYDPQTQQPQHEDPVSRGGHRVGPPTNADSKQLQDVDLEQGIGPQKARFQGTPYKDGPKDQHSTKDSHSAQQASYEDEGSETECISLWKKWQDGIALRGAVLFMILHITAGLGFPLVSNDSNMTDPLALFLLGYWYISLTFFLIREYRLKEIDHESSSYTRGVIVEGIISCLGGFYILNGLLHTSVFTAATAMPSCITLVLLYEKFF